MNHVFALDSNRCIVCGVLKGSTLEGPSCPGVPEYVCEPDEPDEPEPRPSERRSGNELCPVCASRPCLAGCKLGLTKEDLEELARKWEAKEHA